MRLEWRIDPEDLRRVTNELQKALLRRARASRGYPTTTEVCVDISMLEYKDKFSVPDVGNVRFMRGNDRLLDVGPEDRLLMYELREYVQLELAGFGSHTGEQLGRVFKLLGI